MEYTIQKLSRLAKISTRTLRYYDEIGLLKPCRINTSGYRIYGSNEVDALQQIMFYKTLGFELSAIKSMMNSPSFNRLDALKGQLSSLEKQRAALDLLINNLYKTILKEEGKINMSDNEKFEAFKKSLIDENEEKYGDEIRQKYGDERVEMSNAKLMSLTEEDYAKMQKISEDLLEKLAYAVKNGEDPKGPLGQEIVAMHKDWLMFTWHHYDTNAHAGLVEMYVADERFKAYYDTNVSGCAAFLREAVLHFLKS